MHPNAHTFTTIINACTQAQDLERGLQVLQRMIQCSALHDVGHTSITPYTTLIRACGKALDVDRAYQVLTIMLEVGVKPNVVTFNCLIDACGKAQQLEKAFQAFRLMQSCYSTPDTITYTPRADRSFSPASPRLLSPACALTFLVSRLLPPSSLRPALTFRALFTGTPR